MVLKGQKMKSRPEYIPARRYLYKNVIIEI